MKKIDKLLLTSFIGPFAVSFGIALFVLVMQFLWLYIDEIAGKGVSIFVMLELIGYLSISTFPMALPIAVLIASVMVMGNLAERYELSSMKSAGVSLLRIMRGLIIAATLVASFSYVCSDFLIPISNLKFKSRLYDIRKQKPALTLEKGVFNEDFRQFVIRIGDKAKDGETIRNVLIEDQTNAGRLKFNQILADSGQMFTTEDKRFFVMNLFNGAQYQEPEPTQGSKQKYPFIRTNFKSMTKVWDMKEFEMSATDEDRFKNQRTMLSMKQLRQAVDSLNREVGKAKSALAEQALSKLKLALAKSTTPPGQRAPVRPSPPVVTEKPAGDSIAPPQPNPVRKTSPKISAAELEAARRRADSSFMGRGRIQSVPPPKNSTVKPGTPADKLPTLNEPAIAVPKLPKQELQKPIDQYASFLETFRAEDRSKLIGDALKNAEAAQNSQAASSRQVENRQKDMVKTAYELYSKYSFALVCLIFLFIGAPMGAIIRKGGFGYPILVSIIFFVTFIMLTILCRKLAESFIMTPFWAAMMPCAVLLPIGAFLTRRALNDSQMFNTDRLDRIALLLRRRFQKQSLEVKSI